MNPHQIITKVCANPLCGQSFDSPRYYNKEYCTPRCRRRGKHERELKRIADTPERDDRFYLQLTNPTVEQLSKYAELLLHNVTGDKPIQLLGTIPYFQTPTGITIAEQFGVEPRQWLMMKRETVSSLVDMLSSSSPL